ncbi:MAG: hypothetical protein PHI24_12420 [Desulfitobacteriaceae bacterium]|nr:hypothetical protein [Desulfitobacteriaceae bacterium]
MSKIICRNLSKSTCRLHYIGLGKYVIGRGSNPTRIEWVPDIKAEINNLYPENPIGEQEENPSLQDKDTIEESVFDTVPLEKEPDIADERKIKLIKNPIGAVSLPNITINVDMSDWSNEKIKIFFKYAYGKFEED